MCCKCKRGERVREFDIFGTPVGVTYKGQASYQTGLGGCVTITLLVIFGGNLLSSVIALLADPRYEKTTKEEFFPYTIHSSVTSLDANEYTLAVGLHL